MLSAVDHVADCLAAAVQAKAGLGYISNAIVQSSFPAKAVILGYLAYQSGTLVFDFRRPEEIVHLPSRFVEAV